MKRALPSAEAAVSNLRERLGLRRWRLLVDPPMAGAVNMARDWALLSGALRFDPAPVLRFYSWQPAALSLGRFQRDAGFSRELLRERGWDLVRRPTGGRAVLHHLELTYSVILPPSVAGGTGVRSSYEVLTGLVNRGLGGLLSRRAGDPAPMRGGGRCPPVAGTPLQANCFARAEECDTVLGEGKLVGSAQVRRDGALLQHGSILLDADLPAWARLFGEPGQIATLSGLMGGPPPAGTVRDAVQRGFEGVGIGFVEDGLTETEEREAAESWLDFALEP